ncbi:MAG: EAL domain-containing protein [Acidovorax sp.]
MLLILVQTSLAIFSSYTLSTVRAYVRGEGLWSRGTQDALQSLYRYLSTRAPEDFERYEQGMAFPLGDLAARQALRQPVPDLAAARDGFLRGGNDAADIPGIIWMFRYFQVIPAFRKTISLWEDSDTPLLELAQLATQIRHTLASGAQVPESAERQFNNQIDGIAQQLLLKSNAFSASLGQQSRLLAWQLIALNAVTAMLLMLVTLLYTRRLVQQRQTFEAQLSWQATHDVLTGLANRRGFEHRLEAAIQALGHRKTTHSLMFIDLDQFKIINDTCGHAAGDEVLRQVTTLLQHGLRTDDLLARMGGDEFAILAEHCDLNAAAQLAERLRHAVQSAQFQWEERSFSITLSIGIAPVADAQTTVEETLRVADIACYLAKENGRNRVEVQRADDQELQKRFGEMGWVQKIRDALEQNRFALYAQEIRALAHQEPGLRVELLLRLRDEAGHIVPPDQFLPAAERYGLMPLIDRWVVHAAFQTLAARLAAHRAAPVARPLTSCAINLSGISLGDDALTGYIREQLARHGIPPALVCFEITETGAITNLAHALRFMNELRTLGCRFALDDFGSGMSSLEYLKQLPVDCIKIDGSFVRDMLNDPTDRAMVEMMGRVGQLMGMTTIAEFVENDAILAALRDIGIDYAQGYAVGRPQPFDPSSFSSF